HLAEVRAEGGKLAEAEAMHLEALAIQRKVLGGEHPEVANSLNDLGFVFLAEGKLAQGEAALREALAMKRKLFGKEHPNAVGAMFNLSVGLREEGKWGEVESIYREALAIARKRSSNEVLDEGTWPSEGFWLST